MANNKSAEKRARQAAKRRQRNRAAKSAVKTAIRHFTGEVAEGDRAGAEERLRAAASKLDKAAARGIIHPNAASRRKSRLARRLNKLNADAVS